MPSLSSRAPSLLACAGFAKVEKRVRTAGGGSTGSVRNLRIREDTAKYLLNLDTNSAYYDPKSRSMREDPNPSKDPAQKTFYGDNFVRQSGEVGGFRDLNVFSITTHERGQDVHMQVRGCWGQAGRGGGRRARHSGKAQHWLVAGVWAGAGYLDSDALACPGQHCSRAVNKCVARLPGCC